MRHHARPRRTPPTTPSIASERIAADRRLPFLLVLLAILLALVLRDRPAHAAGGTGPGKPRYEWAGTVEVTMHGPKIAGDGELTTTWVIDVRWRERERIPVRDAEGRLAGEFVLLEDDGTTWTGSRHGLLEARRECSLTISRYEGRGSGTRSIDSGWLFFSNVAESRLTEHLADGSYHVYSGLTGGDVHGTTTRTYHDTCRGGSTTDRREDPLLPLAFSMGREIFHPRAGTREFSAEHLASTLERSRGHGAAGLHFLDTERRRLHRSRMSGSYRSGDDGGRHPSWEVEWNVERRAIASRSTESIGPPVRPWRDGAGLPSITARTGSGIFQQTLIHTSAPISTTDLATH